MNRARPAILIAAALLAGCSSPCARMEQTDLRWYAEDRYQFACEMPAGSKAEGLDKVHAFWEAIEVARHVDKDTDLTLDGESMSADRARGRIHERIRETERQAGITGADYCARACIWTASVPAKIVYTPVEALIIAAQSPVTNWER